MTSSIQEKWFFRTATGAIHGPYREDAMRGLINDKAILRETEIWSSLSNTKVSAGTSARFAGYFPQRIVLDSSDSSAANVDSFGKATQQPPHPARHGSAPQIPVLQSSAKLYTNSIEIEFALIPAGSLMMGSDKEKDKGAGDDETPQHRVSISRPFYLGKYEVTQEQWHAVMGNNPSQFKGRNNPVERVSWDDTQAFISRLNQREGHKRYRLPTEAEWEYAARAGSTSVYSFGDDAGQLDRYAWYGESPSSGSTHPVGRKQPNAWGLYDMHGNVWEWVQDWYADWYYSNSPDIDPNGPSTGSYRVSRGGSWSYGAIYCRAAYRYYNTPHGRSISLGFRLALSTE